jgi:signal transduction histidine kinase
MKLMNRVTTFWGRIGPRARDVVFIVIALASSLAQALAGRSHDAPVRALVFGIGAAGAISLWWRRRHPVVITVIGMIVMAITLVPVVVAVGLFTLAIRRRDRVLAIATIAVAALLATISSITSDTGAVLEPIIGGLLGAGFCTAAGAYVGARRDLVATLRERAERAEEERELRAEQAKVGERARIAREMHDVLAHKVSLIALHAGALEVNATADSEQVARTAGLIRTTAREAMEDLRDVLGVLRSGAEADTDDLTPQPRAADIQRVVDASVAAGVHAELTMEVGDMPDAVARGAHRVVREGLTNVHKHARGATTFVTVVGDEVHGVRVEVVNRCPVAGASLLPGSGSGLLGLRERVALLGGTLDAGPASDGGWRLAAWLPWHGVAALGGGVA